MNGFAVLVSVAIQTDLRLAYRRIWDFTPRTWSDRQPAGPKPGHTLVKCLQIKENRIDWHPSCIAVSRLPPQPIAGDSFGPEKDPT
jgi:hypothetical protein